MARVQGETPARQRGGRVEHPGMWVTVHWPQTASWEVSGAIPWAIFAYASAAWEVRR